MILQNTKGSQIAEQIKTNPYVTGIVFAHHILAERFFEYGLERNSSILESMSVAVIGNPVWASFCTPTITLSTKENIK